MKSEGDLVSARAEFLNNRFQNLDFLLRSRYGWMNDLINAYLSPPPVIIEIGCGAGFSPLYIDAEVMLTDAVKNEWVDKIIDATNMDIEDESIDIMIASHTIHHFYSLVKFFNEATRVLKPNGLILINEINTSVLMRILLKLMKHEGWNYDIDIFDINAVVNDPSDPWSANCAVSQLLFGKNRQKFENNFKSLKVIIDKPCECFIFPLSGGVTAKTKVPHLPYWLLAAFNKLDSLLVRVAPQIFALSRRIVLKKTT
ncbi:MAG: class I SAM-dependent methyltransferase [Bacteroidales bacterium]|nr:class I SAM-dependent methyltransferase [Bacteroidales bacterium]